jgi:pseudouridylate synthase
VRAIWVWCYDISTDLGWLANSGVCVVASGIKSILDIPATLEVLETLGVPVLGYQTSSVPTFYSTTSPFAVQARCDGIDELASVVCAHQQVGMHTGLLVCNPVPDAEAIPAEVVEAWTQDALALAAQRGVRGKATTPFLLSHIHHASQGASLRANLALIESNAALAARLAATLAGRAVGTRAV